MGRKSKPADGWITVKIRQSTRVKIGAAIAYVSRRGWGAVGLDRDEPPALGAVVDAAVDALLRRPPRKALR